MKAYITLVATLILFGFLFFLGELDMALDGEKMSTTALLLGGLLFCAGLHIGLLFFPVYKEEINETLKSWFTEEEEPETEEGPEEDEPSEQRERFVRGAKDKETLYWKDLTS